MGRHRVPQLRYCSADSNQLGGVDMATNRPRSLVGRHAGIGLAPGSGGTLDVDLSELGAAAVDVAADSLPIITAAGGSKQEAVADLVTALAGQGLAVTAGVAYVDLDAQDDAVLDPAADTIPFIDESAAGDPTKLESVADFVSAIASGKTIEAVAGVLKVKAGALKHVLADGTASAANVTVAGMAVGDELISVHAQATKASVGTITDRTAEYVVGAGVLTKAGGTNETNNQLDIWYWDRT